MATMKAEFLAHHYAGRIRPRAHYSMGWLPAVAQVASRAPAAGQRAHPGTRPARRPDHRRAASTGAAGSRCSPRQTLQAWYAAARSRAGGAARRGRAVAGHLHQPPRPGDRDGGRRGPGGGGLAGHRAQPAAVLRSDLDLHRAAGHRPAGAAAHRRRPGPVSAARRQGRRARAELHGGIPVRRPRADARQPRCPAAAAADRHAGRAAAGSHRRLAAAAPGREGDRADPLPPARHHGLRRGPGAACTPPGSTWMCWTQAAAGWPATSASKPGTTTCPGPAASGSCSRPCATRPPDTLVLADGFSCRTQIEQAGTGRTPVHLAEILAAGLRGEPVRPSRPTPPRPADYARLAGIAATGAGAAAALAARRRKG